MADVANSYNAYVLRIQRASARANGGRNVILIFLYFNRTTRQEKTDDNTIMKTDSECQTEKSLKYPVVFTG